MAYITLGQFNIPIAWLAFFAAVLYSDWRSKRADAETTKLLERFIFTYIAVWKLSYVAFSFDDFVQAPLSALYFDGGISGHLLALAVVLLLLYRSRQAVVWTDLWHYWSRFVSVYMLVTALFQQQWFIGAVVVILLVMVERTKEQLWLIVQFALLAWLYGFTSSLVLVHAVVLLTLVVKRKQLQYAAAAGVLSLVVLMIGDIEQATEQTARAAIQLPTTTGALYDVAQQPQSLTVVNFFATWCPPCKAEMPHLQSFAEDLPAGVELIGVNLTERDHGRTALDAFMAKYDVTYPILLDEADTVGTNFQVMSIPTTVLLNAQGEELTRIVGPVSEEALRQLIKQY